MTALLLEMVVKRGRRKALLGLEISSAYKYHVTIEICLQMINLSIEMSMSESKALARTLFELQRRIFLPFDHGRIYIY